MTFSRVFPSFFWSVQIPQQFQIRIRPPKPHDFCRGSQDILRFFFIFLRISPDTTPIPDRTNFLNFGCPCWFLSRLNFIFFFQPENVRSGSRGVNDKNTFLFLKNTEKHTIWTRFTRGNLTLFCKNYKKLDFDAITTCIILDVFFCENTKIRPDLPLIRPTTKSVWSGIVVLGART